MMSLTVTALTPAVGAEISNADLARLSDTEFAEIERAWYGYSALLFRDQHLTDDDLLAFSQRFGELDPPPQPGAR
jgi:taurine dioxygenase